MLEKLVREATEYAKSSPLNYIPKDNTYSEAYEGIRIWEDPVICVADASDPLFESLKDPNVLHPDAMMPKDWIPDAKSVVSFFMPFNRVIKEDNAADLKKASELWMLGSSLGQIFIADLSRHLVEFLQENGYEAVAPAVDKRLKMAGSQRSGWSERHIAYVCGQGTFGMSRGLITEKGIAGRFGSLVTNAPMTVTQRKYSSPFEYCIQCGACQRNCPGDAIDMERGFSLAKDNAICGQTLGALCAPYQREDRPHYHCCGKCQVGVPCAYGIPKKA